MAGTIPAPAPPQPHKVRRRVGEVAERPGLILAAVGVAVALIFAVTPLSGIPGWALCTYAGFVVADAFDTYRTEGPVVAKDRIATVLIATAGICTVVPLAGRTQLVAGTVDFAGSDLPAVPAEADQLRAKYGDFTYIPNIAGAVSIQYNVPGIKDLKLSGATLARIFSGKVTNWDDPAIAADNGSAGPNLPIQVFVRSDKSGTSGVFTGRRPPADGRRLVRGRRAQAPGGGDPGLTHQRSSSVTGRHPNGVPPRWRRVSGPAGPVSPA